jgi:hypothetical protein
MASALCGQDDPTQVYFEGPWQVLETTTPDGGRRLTIPLPFAARGDVTLRQTGDELFRPGWRQIG